MVWLEKNKNCRTWKKILPTSHMVHGEVVAYNKSLMKKSIAPEGSSSDGNLRRGVGLVDDVVFELHFNLG